MTSLPKKIFVTLLACPFTLGIIHIPEAILGTLQRLLETTLEGHPVIAFLVFFPFFTVMSSFTAALTLLVVLDLEQKKKPSLKRCLSEVGRRASALATSGLLVGLVCILGLCALVLPAIYFMALYLFVPLVIMTEHDQEIPVYLYRSTQIAKKSLWHL